MACSFAARVTTVTAALRRLASIAAVDDPGSGGGCAPG
jgi:hypothetical protein